MGKSPPEASAGRREGRQAGLFGGGGRGTGEPEDESHAFLGPGSILGNIPRSRGCSISPARKREQAPRTPKPSATLSTRRGRIPIVRFSGHVRDARRTLEAAGTGYRAPNGDVRAAEGFGVRGACSRFRSRTQSVAAPLCNPKPREFEADPFLGGPVLHGVWLSVLRRTHQSPYARSRTGDVPALQARPRVWAPAPRRTPPGAARCSGQGGTRRDIDRRSRRSSHPARDGPGASAGATSGRAMSPTRKHAFDSNTN